MTEERPSHHPLVPSRREQVIDKLTEFFASDMMTLEDFERRLDRAHSAKSLDELDALTSDLTGQQASTTLVPTESHHRRKNSFVLGFWSGATRSGAWAPARKNLIVAFQGGVELDLRDARLPPGRTDFTVFCAMGGVSIIVPPNLAVEFGGIGFMGAFEHEPGEAHETGPHVPYVRINGLAVWGGASIEVRRSGETASEAKQRKRLERKVKKSLAGPRP